METITEEMKVHTQWYEDAKKQTLETLPKFLSHIMDDYNHDYGTICHALAAGATATAWAMNKHDNGGITGFQAGAVMWEFIRSWNFSSNKTGLKLVDYDNFLYPQYRDKYEKTISESVWKAIQDEALTHLSKADKEYAEYLKKAEQYKIDIAAFVKKFPDYYEREEHYNHLGMGTGDEWDAYNKKKESGFEFAPTKPYEPIYKDSPVYKHWVSIVGGKIPFGYQISDD